MTGVTIWSRFPPNKPNKEKKVVKNDKKMSEKDGPMIKELSLVSDACFHTYMIYYLNLSSINIWHLKNNTRNQTFHILYMLPLLFVQVVFKITFQGQRNTYSETEEPVS